MLTFQGRLERCVRLGDLTVSDLARWFDRPRSTVNTWLAGRTPYDHGPSGHRATADLALLEQAIRARVGFPVPVGLTWRLRAKHLQDHRDAFKRDAGVSPLRAAR